ncbi:MAG: ATP-binding protein [Candidatus Rokubacteria bacterium]|nr:ATP-binding protein [Candidatus Rokubacteria bacterium]
MRLAPKIFLASAVVILILVGVAGWSILAINRLVGVNREIVTQSLPALRHTTSLREALVSLVRLEHRALVLKDASYATLWAERANRASADFEVLRTFLVSEEEQAQQREALLAFAAYRRLVAMERELVGRNDLEGALRLAEGEARLAAERIEGALDRLLLATYSALERSHHEARALEASTWSTALAALVAGVILALAASGVIAFRMTRSLRQLSVATALLAEGRFSAPVRVRARDEIGDVARSFNRMAERLREVDQLKEEFFSHISHELRTPLTSVREATHLLLERVPGPLEGKQVRLVEIIGASAERLLKLVNQILDLSRLRAHLLPLARGRVDLERLTARSLDELRPQAEEGGLTLSRVANGTDFAVWGDEDALVRVVVNLLDNAVKFTPPGGSVTVRLSDLGAEVALAVEDTGVGIPPASLVHIFDPYRQVHTRRSGSGLGLAIVKGLVEAHRGRIHVESEEGRGTRFVVRLPRGAPAVPATAPVAARREGARAGRARWLARRKRAARQVLR